MKFTKADHHYMDRALQLAEYGLGKTNPNPLVGAVVVNKGMIVGEGYHAEYGSDHAEVTALHQAGEQAKESTLYVTLEPCSHYGKTPPCTQRIIDSGVKRVIVAALDPHSKVCGKGKEELQQAGIQVDLGLKEEQAVNQNEIFRKYITTKQPFVISKWGMSLDGKIATATLDAKWITDLSARQDGHIVRAKVSAIMVGIGTVLADDPYLTVRHPNYPDRHPIRVIVDTNLKIPPTANVLGDTDQVSTIVATQMGQNKDKQKAIQATGAHVMEVPSDDSGGLDLANLITELGKDGIDSILVEGGARIHGSLVDGQLVDKFICYIGSKIIGGEHAPTPVKGKGCMTIADSLTLQKFTVNKFDSTIKISGYPNPK